MSAPVDSAIKYWELHEISTSCLRYGDVRVDDWGVLRGAVNDHRDVHVNSLAQFFVFLDDAISPFLQRFTPARLILHPLDIDLLSNLFVLDLRQRRNGQRFLSLIRHYLKFLEVVSLLPAEGANCRWFILEGREGN